MNFKDFIYERNIIFTTDTDYRFIDDNLTDLCGIEKYNIIEKLYLSYNKITDISPLKFLTTLDYLDVTDNLITNIEAVKFLTQLNRLFLNRNNITDLRPLYNLTNLRELSLWNVPITDKDLEELMCNNKSIVSLWIEGTLVSAKYIKRGWIIGKELNELKNELLISRRKRLISLLN